MDTVTTMENRSRVAFGTTVRSRKRSVGSTGAIQVRRPGNQSIKAILEAILKRDLDTLGTPTSSTTEAILHDPIWRGRLRVSLAQAHAGNTRPIEDYWADSD